MRPPTLALTLTVVLLASTSAAQPADQPTEVTVEIAARDGQPIDAESYVAIVANGQPWEHPLVEATLAPGEAPARFELPPGEYRIFCSASGFGHRAGKAFRAAAGAPLHEVCFLRRLVAMTGRVLSAETGRPLPGATIGPVGFFLEHYDKKLSPEGERHLRAKYVATSDRDGTFTLLGMPEHKANLLVQAEGAAPAYLPETLVPASGGALGDIVLQPGGALHVALTLPPALDPEALRVLLEPIDLLGRFPWDDLPHDLWTRPVGADGRASWKGLPVGAYEVFLEGAARSDGEILGVAVVRKFDLSFFELELADVVVEGSLAGLPAEEVPYVHLSLATQTNTAEAELSVVEGEANQPEVRYRVRLGRAGRYWPLLEPAGGSTTIVPGTAMAPFDVGAVSGTLEHDLDLPENEVTGVVVDEADGVAVGAGKVVVTRAGTGGHTSWAALCVTRPGPHGRFVCPHLPEGEYLAAARDQDIGVSGVETLSVGQATPELLLSLRPGRTISGEVVGPHGKPLARARVGFALERVPELLVLGETDRQGRFTLPNLPPGEGVVMANPEERALGFAVERIPPSDSDATVRLQVGEGGNVVVAGPGVGHGEGTFNYEWVLDGEPLRLPMLSYMATLWTPASPGVGGFALSLKPGTYRVRWLDPTGAELGLSRKLRVEAGQTTVTELEIE